MFSNFLVGAILVADRLGLMEPSFLRKKTTRSWAGATRWHDSLELEGAEIPLLRPTFSLDL